MERFTRYSLWFLAGCGLWLAATMACAGEPSDVVPIQGATYRASILSIDADWRLVLDVDGERSELHASQMVAWGAPVEATRGQQIVLADGSLLVADVTGSDERDLHVASAAFSEVAIPLSAVAGVIWHPPAGPGRRDRLLARLMPPPAAAAGAHPVADSDTLILENGDELAGTVQQIGPAGVDFSGDVGPVQIETSRVAAVIFNASLLERAAQADLWAFIGCKDGSLLAARAVLLDEQQASLTLACGVSLACPAQTIVYLQVFGGQAGYLSDRESESYRHIPFLSLAWPFEVDRNVAGERLRAGGRTYIKGIGMHSAARLTYRLQKDDRQFQAELAIDDRAQGRGSVVFRVFVDDRERFKSGTVRGGDSPLPISVDVVGGKRLSLIVDFAERGDESDHANWLNARVVK